MVRKKFQMEELERPGLNIVRVRWMKTDGTRSMETGWSKWMPESGMEMTSRKGHLLIFQNVDVNSSHSGLDIRVDAFLSEE